MNLEPSCAIGENGKYGEVTYIASLEGGRLSFLVLLAPAYHHFANLVYYTLGDQDAARTCGVTPTKSFAIFRIVPRAFFRESASSPEGACAHFARHLAELCAKNEKHQHTSLEAIAGRVIDETRFKAVT